MRTWPWCIWSGEDTTGGSLHVTQSWLWQPRACQWKLRCATSNAQHPQAPSNVWHDDNLDLDSLTPWPCPWQTFNNFLTLFLCGQNKPWCPYDPRTLLWYSYDSYRLLLCDKVTLVKKALLRRVTLCKLMCQHLRKLPKRESLGMWDTQEKKPPNPLLLLERCRNKLGAIGMTCPLVWFS